MTENSHIDKNTFDYLKPDKPKSGRFYLLPKTHKVNNPGRPIVSASGHPKKKISEFVDFHLRPHVEALPSYLKDTTDYLQKNGIHESPSFGDHLFFIIYYYINITPVNNLPLGARKPQRFTNIYNEQYN